MSNKLIEALNATSISRHQYLEDKGFNGANEGGEEATKNQLGFIVTDSAGEEHWLSDALFKQLEELVEEDVVKPINLPSIFNVYSHNRRDEVNAKSLKDKPEFIRVTGGEDCIPDDYTAVEYPFGLPNDLVYDRLYQLIKPTEE